MQCDLELGGARTFLELSVLRYRVQVRIIYTTEYYGISQDRGNTKNFWRAFSKAILLLPGTVRT